MKRIFLSLTATLVFLFFASIFGCKNDSRRPPENAVNQERHDQNAENDAISDSTDLSPAVMREAVDYLYKLLLEVHPDPFNSMSEDEFFQVYQSVLKACDQPLAPEDFYFEANRLVIPIKDAHTKLHFTGPTRYLPIRLMNTSEDIGIIEASEGFSFLVGDRVRAIDGIPVEQLLNDLSHVVPSENAEWVAAVAPGLLRRDIYLEYLLSRTLVADVDFSLERDGEVGQLTIPFRLANIPRDNYHPYHSYQTIPEMDAMYFRSRTFKYIEEYHSVVDEMFGEISQKNIGNLIVDIRGNTGGDSSTVDYFLDKLMWWQIKYYSCRILMSEQAASQREFRHPLLVRLFVRLFPRILTPEYGGTRTRSNVTDGEELFSGNLFIVVNGKTFSSANWLANIVQDNHLGKIIGTRTGNAPTHFGDPLQFKLPNVPIKAWISHKLWIRPDRSRDPATSVVPDVLVPMKLDDYSNRHDTQLDWLVSELYKADSKQCPKRCRLIEEVQLSLWNLGNRCER